VGGNFAIAPNDLHMLNCSCVATNRPTDRSHGHTVPIVPIRLSEHYSIVVGLSKNLLLADNFCLHTTKLVPADVKCEIVRLKCTKFRFPLELFLEPRAVGGALPQTPICIQGKGEGREGDMRKGKDENGGRR